MNLELINKTAIVTGGTTGIGLAIAKTLYQEGVHVTITGRSDEKLKIAAQNILQTAGNGHINCVQVDVGTSYGCQELIQQIPSIDILINNLGPYYESNFLNDDTDSRLIELFEINVMSGVRLSKYYLKDMLQKNSGRIIFIGAEDGIAVYPNLIDHGITKAAQLALKNGLAELTKNSCVTVNSVLPGPTITEGVTEYFKDKDFTEATLNLFANECAASILKRWINPQEIANLVVYLASPLSAATNGASLRADGGILKG